MEHRQNPNILDQDNRESMIIGEMWKSKDLESEQSGVHDNNEVSSVHLPGDEIMYDILFLTVSLFFFCPCMRRHSEQHCQFPVHLGNWDQNRTLTI